VLEQPQSYSFPLLASGPRLFLAESVAAVIEVKSNLSSQWGEVKITADKLARVRRKYSSSSYQDIINQLDQGQIAVGPTTDVETIRKDLVLRTTRAENNGEERIRFFVVGYSGWSQNRTIVSKLEDNKIDGILQIDRRVFCTKLGRADGFEDIEGYKSLLGLLHWRYIFLKKYRKDSAHRTSTSRQKLISKMN